MHESSTDRTLITIMIIIAVMIAVIYFSPYVTTRSRTGVWQSSAPASAGTVVRTISPMNTSSRGSSYYSSENTSSRTTTTPGPVTTTTYYQTY